MRMILCPATAAASISALKMPFWRRTIGASTAIWSEPKSRRIALMMSSWDWGLAGMPQSGQYWVPSLTKSRRRKCRSSVVVPTVERRPPREVRCSMATVGGMPRIESTSGAGAGWTMLRA